jgi:ABC-type antimicrobial peptide transport system permease subunit
MFFTYVGRELRRRRRQAFVVALGLALGIGLVVTVSAMASGVRSAQASVLHSLYGVGTDVTVTRTAKAGTGGPARFGLAPGQNQQGRRFSRDRITPTQGLAALSSAKVQTVASLPHVAAATGGLSLQSIHVQGRFIDFGNNGSGGGLGQPGAQPTTRPSVPPIRITAYSIDGVDVSSAVGPVSSSQVTGGRYFHASESGSAVALIDQSYAKQHRLAVGSTISINGTSFRVIGIVRESSGGSGTDVFIPLSRAQALAGMKGEVNRIYVKASSAAQIAAVKTEISQAVSGSTVTTASDLASQVTGSLSSASSLSGHLGTWLSIIALVVAFAVASLLTLSAVTRRTREFGTLKALGWRSRRVVGQVMGESVAQGIIGGALGIGLGVAGAALIAHFSPSLTATVGSSASSTSGPGGPFGQAAATATHTVKVALTAPIHPTLLLLAVALALVGGVLAGSLGGWRAARLRPAEALRRVE